MEKIKVAFFAETLEENYDGAVRTMYQLINRIPQQKFEYLFICGVAPKRRLPFKVLVMPSMTIPFNHNYKIVLPFLSNFRITKALDVFQPDLVHIATPSPMGHFALDFAQKRAIPVLSIYHTHFLSYVDYYLKNTPFLIEPTRRRIAKKSCDFYDNCDLVYVPTREMIHYLERYNHQTKRMKIWQRGIDHQLFNPSKKRPKMIRGISQNDKPNILFVSRLVWEKNLQTLVDFYQTNQKNGAPYNLIIAGDGVARTELEEQMPKAFFLGSVNHQKLAQLYASADVFLFTSITETYGNVVIEAMSSGLPCVIANGGGSKSFIESGVNGFLCHPTDANDYFQKIQNLMNQPALHQTFVKNGLQYTKDLCWDTLANIYFEDVKKLAVLNKEAIAAA
jgi:glycosyltransferase involved in cell wall biosynthesis